MSQLSLVEPYLKLIFNLILVVVVFTLSGQLLLAQTEKKKFTLNGGADLYYSYNFNKPLNGVNDYFVSYHNNHKPSLNLVYVKGTFKTKNIRVNAAPAFGTYMQANYAPEPIIYRNILEANAGILINKKNNIWIDVGVMPSPIGDENYFSNEQLTISRSLASEYTPYYLNGAKLAFDVSKQINVGFYVVNGWQQIKDVNTQKSVVVNVCYMPFYNLILNYVLYAGNHKNIASPQMANRLMHNFYATYKINKYELAFNTFVTSQKIKSSFINKTASIFSSNIKARYNFYKQHFISARAEYFNDKDEVDIKPVNPNANGFDAFGYSCGYDFKINNKIFARTEFKSLYSRQPIFIKNNAFVNANQIFYMGLVATF
ncbi:MAG: outer membrane beta-barrel protein [Bacteroidia bacterium]